MNEDSRPSSPEAPPQDLWSTILNSVSSSRSIPTKNILVLGQPSTGKSTLVSAILQKTAADASKDEPRTDFALGYDWADVRDEGEEGLSLLLYPSIYIPTTPPPARRYPCPVIRIHCPVICPFIYSPLVALLAPSIHSPPYCCHNCAGLDTALDLPRGFTHMALLD